MFLPIAMRIPWPYRATTRASNGRCNRRCHLSPSVCWPGRCHRAHHSNGGTTPVQLAPRRPPGIDVAGRQGLMGGCQPTDHRKSSGVRIGISRTADSHRRSSCSLRPGLKRRRHVTTVLRNDRGRGGGCTCNRREIRLSRRVLRRQCHAGTMVGHCESLLQTRGVDGSPRSD